MVSPLYKLSPQGTKDLVAPHPNNYQKRVKKREVGFLYTNKERALLQSKIRSCLRPDW